MEPITFLRTEVRDRADPLTQGFEDFDDSTRFEIFFHLFLLFTLFNNQTQGFLVY